MTIHGQRPTGHFLLRRAQRSVAWDDVEQALAAPFLVQAEREGRRRHLVPGLVAGRRRWLSVVTSPDQRLVTCFWLRRMGEGTACGR